MRFDTSLGPLETRLSLIKLKPVLYPLLHKAFKPGSYLSWHRSEEPGFDLQSTVAKLDPQPLRKQPLKVVVCPFFNGYHPCRQPSEKVVYTRLRFLKKPPDFLSLHPRSKLGLFR